MSVASLPGLLLLGFDSHAYRFATFEQPREGLERWVFTRINYVQSEEIS